MKKIFCAICALLIICAAAFAEAPELNSKGYVLVSTASESKWFPLPDEELGEYSFTVKQQLNGEEIQNTITIFTDGVYVSESNCENQDCIEEGTVTLENMKERVLGNMIVCLPHSLTVQLYSREELLEFAAQQQAQAETENGSEAAK